MKLRVKKKICKSRNRATKQLVELTNSGSTISWICKKKKQFPKAVSDETRARENQLRDEFSASVITAGNRAANSVGFAIRAIRWNHARLRTPRRVTRVRPLMGARNAWVPCACSLLLSHSHTCTHFLSLSLSHSLSSLSRSLRCTGGLALRCGLGGQSPNRRASNI